jgi:hypothetical protein
MNSITVNTRGDQSSTERASRSPINLTIPEEHSLKKQESASMYKNI